MRAAPIRPDKRDGHQNLQAFAKRQEIEQVGWRGQVPRQDAVGGINCMHGKAQPRRYRRLLRRSIWCGYGNARNTDCTGQGRSIKAFGADVLDPQDLRARQREIIQPHGGHRTGVRDPQRHFGRAFGKGRQIRQRQIKNRAPRRRVIALIDRAAGLHHHPVHQQLDDQGHLRRSAAKAEGIALGAIQLEHTKAMLGLTADQEFQFEIIRRGRVRNDPPLQGGHAPQPEIVKRTVRSGRNQRRIVQRSQ